MYMSFCCVLFFVPSLILFVSQGHLNEWSNGYVRTMFLCRCQLGILSSVIKGIFCSLRTQVLQNAPNVIGERARGLGAVATLSSLGQNPILGPKTEVFGHLSTLSYPKIPKKSQYIPKIPEKIHTPTYVYAPWKKF